MRESDNHQTTEPEEIFLVHMPSLVSVLLNKENEKGSPLTESEVLEITNSSACIAMPLYAKKKVEESRGYLDINPENSWEEWQAARTELIGS
ncbi:hypothetical protein L5L78_23350 [Shewanella sp. SM34]|uniref:hypothetical protein n=1 Tax=unclassified Shewanella TaxID=196818 RepID=UPI0021DA0899|nr:MULTISPECIES: hypothetical protein [unclassified Shewanella]MCU8059084.1 hypothetical protein [Shewanella sp. SM35]MCU8068005.1 hypothetical protein [Shewanella sp. SM34]